MPGWTGQDIRNLLISRRMDCRCPGKLLHQLQLRGTVGTRLRHRIYNKACHRMANSRRKCLISEWCRIRHNHRCNGRWWGGDHWSTFSWFWNLGEFVVDSKTPPKSSPMGRTWEGFELIVLLYPGGCISAEFLGVGFIKWSEEFKDGIGWSIAFRPAKACEFGFQMIREGWTVGPNLFDKIWRDVVNEQEGSADNFGLCHNWKD